MRCTKYIKVALVLWNSRALESGSPFSLCITYSFWCDAFVILYVLFNCVYLYFLLLCSLHLCIVLLLWKSNQVISRADHSLCTWHGKAITQHGISSIINIIIIIKIIIITSLKRKAKYPLRNAQEVGQLSKDAWREMKNFLTGMRMMTMILKREKRINVMALVITIQFRKDDEGNTIYSG